MRRRLLHAAACTLAGLATTTSQAADGRSCAATSCAATGVVPCVVEQPRCQASQSSEVFAPRGEVVSSQSESPATPTSQTAWEPAQARPVAQADSEADNHSYVLPVTTTTDDDEYPLARADASPPSGFLGHCPVAFRDGKTLTAADAAHEAVFEFQTYAFSSAEALATFQRDPAKYAPVAEGLDVVLARLQDCVANGSVEHCRWFRDRLYFFASAESAALFTAEPTRFAVP